MHQIVATTVKRLPEGCSLPITVGIDPLRSQYNRIRAILRTKLQTGSDNFSGTLIAEQSEGHFSPWLSRSQGITHALVTIDDLSVDLQDDILGLEAGPRRRAVVCDLADDDSILGRRVLDTELLQPRAHVAVIAPVRDADPRAARSRPGGDILRPRDLAVLDKLLGHPLRRVRWDREPDPDVAAGWGRDGRVDSDQVAVQVGKRAP